MLPAYRFRIGCEDHAPPDTRPPDARYPDRPASLLAELALQCGERIERSRLFLADHACLLQDLGSLGAAREGIERQREGFGRGFAEIERSAGVEDRVEILLGELDLVVGLVLARLGEEADFEILFDGRWKRIPGDAAG